MKQLVAAALAALLAGTGALAVAAASARELPRIPRASATMADLQGVNFVTVCRFSHRAPDDPIVAPGRPGASHDHTFVGNTSTDAFSTLRSLRAASTTCRRRADTAAYWAPTLVVGGAPVEPLAATIYYRRRSLAPVRPFPAGFRMIAGDATARSPQPQRVTFWNCGVAAGMPRSETVPACPEGRANSLRLHVTFPSCWDGRRLDSVDHQSHVRYPMRARCPQSHPIALPAIALILRYPINGSVGAELSSGGQFSAHADFFNAWRQGQLTRLVHGCLNALRHCAQGS